MYNYLAWDPGVKIKEVRVAPITTGTQAISGGYLLRAGTPLNNSYAVKNASGAKYIVAEDYIFYTNDPAHNTDPIRLIEAGYVDLKKAEAASGLTYASAAKTSLKSNGIFLLSGDEANVSSGTYDLPTASANTLGGVKVGEGLSIADGVLSASGGSGGGVFKVVITFGDESAVMNKTWQEIKDAVDADSSVVFVSEDGDSLLFYSLLRIGPGLLGSSTVIVFGLVDSIDSITFSAASASDYPTYHYM